jgi:hypothetical protein
MVTLQQLGETLATFCYSVSDPEPDSTKSADPDPGPDPGHNCPRNKEKKIRDIISEELVLYWAEGFSGSLNVLAGF